MKSAIKLPEEVKKLFVAWGTIGGMSKSKRKLDALALNRMKPCAPGKRRGRPKGSKNKKK